MNDERAIDADVAETVGTVRQLRRYPVKSMLGEELQSVELTRRGVVGDRRFALLDDETGKVVSVKRPARWGRMFDLTATTSGGTVVVAVPGGETLAVDDPHLPAQLSALFGRPVSIAERPPRLRRHRGGRHGSGPGWPVPLEDLEDAPSASPAAPLASSTLATATTLADL